MLDAKIAPALKKVITSVHFRRRVSVEEQRAQKDDRFLWGKQIAYMIYDHFRATGAYDAAQGLSDLFNIGLHEDDVQDFETKWDHALLAVGEIPSETVLEGQDSVQRQTVLGMYEQENVRNNDPPNYSRLKSPERNSGKRSSNQESERWEQSACRGKWENASQRKASGQCSKGYW